MNNQRWIRFLTIIYIGICAVALPSHAAPAQEVFDSPDKAAESLAAATKTGDTARIIAILGEGGRAIVSSGDAVYDKTIREDFIRAYDEKHDIALEGDSKATLVIGKDDWPFAIPIVKKQNGWQFDVAQGKQELLFRRIGRNEQNVMQVALAYVDAQNDYADMMRKEKGLATYAQRIVSQPGKKDGLYWPTDNGTEVSPLGDFMAQAAAEGYEKKSEQRIPYHGYYYKILTRQGPDAKGGAINYIAKGKMIGGFALVAWPATYKNSGVMTFIVNHDGTIYQKDLGPNTAKIIAEMTSFNPDKTWQPVDVEQLRTEPQH